MPSTREKTTDGFTKEERAAMKERARELKASAKKEDLERDMLAKIAEMTDADRAIAERVHAIVTENAPQLDAKTWYGMPAWTRDGKVVCFFQAAEKFGTRYATLGFDAEANLDDGNMWATGFAVTKLTAVEEKRIVALVTQAVS